MYELLDKILVYQKALPDPRAVELEELEQRGILSADDLEFMTSHAITYAPHRRTDRHAGDMLSLPIEDGSISVGPRGPAPTKRLALLRDFHDILEIFFALPLGETNPFLQSLNVKLSERDSLIVNPKVIMIFLGSPAGRSCLANLREVGRELGLTLQDDRELHGMSSLIFLLVPDRHRGIAAVVTLLRRGFDFDDNREINYSASSLDELEGEGTGWSGTMGSESRVSQVCLVDAGADKPESSVSPESSSAHSLVQNSSFRFIRSCIETAVKRKGGAAVHVNAQEILAVAAEVARALFGEDAASVLRREGIGSSAAFGQALFRLIEQGILSTTEDDKVSDFDVRSSFDKLFVES
jgi:uncharacterized repeat protein (TIGR04138 family)